MKFTISFYCKEPIDGINSIMAVQGWIYRNMERVNPELANWLHNKGIFKNNKVMKPINFSPVYKTQRKNIYGIKVSTLVPKIQHAIVEMLNDPEPLVLKGKNERTISLNVSEVKMKKLRDTKVYFTLSPIIFRDKDGFVKLDFTKEEDIEKARQIIEHNLAWKYECIYDEVCPYRVYYFQPKNMKTAFYTNYEIQSKDIKIPLTGYTGNFTLIADQPLLDMAYYFGIGYMTGSGFGCIESEAK